MATTGPLGKHVKDHGQKWLIAMASLSFLAYLYFAINTGVKFDQAFAKVVLVIVATLTVVGGISSLILFAVADDSELGELKTMKKELTLGLLVGVAASVFTLLGIFGILKP